MWSRGSSCPSVQRQHAGLPCYFAASPHSTLAWHTSQHLTPPDASPSHRLAVRYPLRCSSADLEFRGGAQTRDGSSRGVCNKHLSTRSNTRTRDHRETCELSRGRIREYRAEFQSSGRNYFGRVFAPCCVRRVPNHCSLPVRLRPVSARGGRASDAANVKAHHVPGYRRLF
jgi:hypothetical protein